MPKCFICKETKKEWGFTLLIISGKPRSVCLNCYEKVRSFNKKNYVEYKEG